MVAEVEPSAAAASAHPDTVPVTFSHYFVGALCLAFGSAAAVVAKVALARIDERTHWGLDAPFLLVELVVAYPVALYGLRWLLRPRHPRKLADSLAFRAVFRLCLVAAAVAFVVAMSSPVSQSGSGF
jgi:hypothetical protein